MLAMKMMFNSGGYFEMMYEAVGNMYAKYLLAFKKKLVSIHFYNSTRECDSSKGLQYLKDKFKNTYFLSLTPPFLKESNYFKAFIFCIYLRLCMTKIIYCEKR